jgi:hypothetical protein
MGQGPQIPPHLEDQVPAPAAVTPGRAAFRDKFFPPKGNAAIASMPGGHLYKGFVREFFHE